MFNSYITSFGPIDKSHKLKEDVSAWMLNHLMSFSNDMHELKDPDQHIPPCPQELSRKDKANILDQCFHLANETFYEIEDDEGFEDGMDRHEAQDVYLDLIEKILER